MSGLQLDHVTLAKQDVMVASEKGAPAEVAMKAFDRLEKALGSIKGRKFYGYYSPFEKEYRACVVMAPGDDPAKFGLNKETLAGGKYLRARIKGEPPELYARIGPVFDDMGNVNETKDFERSYLEFYRSRNEVELLVPLL